MDLSPFATFITLIKASSHSVRVRGFKLSVSHTLQVRGYVALRMECVDSSEGGMGHVYNGEEGTHIPYGMCGFKYKKSRFSKQTKTQLE